MHVLIWHSPQCEAHSALLIFKKPPLKKKGDCRCLAITEKLLEVNTFLSLETGIILGLQMPPYFTLSAAKMKH